MKSRPTMASRLRTSSRHVVVGLDRAWDGWRGWVESSESAGAVDTVCSGMLDPRVQSGVGQVAAQVDGEVDDGGEQGEGLHRRVVGGEARLDDVRADAGPAEDRLGDDRSAEELAELEPDDGDDDGGCIL